MNWTQHIDGYCERLAPGFWAEPLNAVSNVAFLLAAFIMWQRVRGQRMRMAVVLVVLLAVIGTGSFLFHTFATVWASLADVVPIALFILAYLFAVNRDFLGWPRWFALLGTAGFIPYAVGATAVLTSIPFLRISNIYWTVPLLIFIYSAALATRAPSTARGLAVGGAILVVSITIRSLDMILCPSVPIGVHFLWHCMNAVMLGWMIEVYRCHRLAGRADRR